MADCAKTLEEADACVPLKLLASELMRLRQLIANTPRLRAKDLQRRYGISESTLYRGIRSGRIPPPIRIPGPLWRLADLELAELTGRLPRPMSA